MILFDVIVKMFNIFHIFLHARTSLTTVDGQNARLLNLLSFQLYASFIFGLEFSTVHRHNPPWHETACLTQHVF